MPQRNAPHAILIRLIYSDQFFKIVKFVKFEMEYTNNPNKAPQKKAEVTPPLDLGRTNIIMPNIKDR